MDIQDLAARVMELGTDFGIKIVMAVVIFVVGKWLARKLTKLMATVMEKSVDKTVARFVSNLAYSIGLAIVIIAALGQLGIQTASFVAIVGAAGLAVGLALQGSLSNFAAGVLLLIFRPIKVGDFVTVAGESGSVEEISIFVTKLTTGDNKLVIIPNSGIMSSNITNFSAKPTRRVDMIVGVSYDADLTQVKRELEQLVAADARILKDPASTIAVAELADSSVNLVCRPWVNAADYWGVKFDLTESIKLRFDDLGIGIPYPQMDIHLPDKTD